MLTNDLKQQQQPQDLNNLCSCAKVMNHPSLTPERLFSPPFFSHLATLYIIYITYFKPVNADIYFMGTLFLFIHLAPPQVTTASADDSFKAEDSKPKQ